MVGELSARGASAIIQASCFLQILKPKKQSSVMGCELSRQLNCPGFVCWSMVVMCSAVN